MICKRVATKLCKTCVRINFKEEYFCDKHFCKLNEHEIKSIQYSKKMLENDVIQSVELDLFAVLCIQRSHYVSYLKCGTLKSSKWIFYDSMSDRIGNF